MTEDNDLIGCLVGLGFVSTYMGNFWRNWGNNGSSDTAIGTDSFKSDLHRKFWL